MNLHPEDWSSFNVDYDQWAATYGLKRRRWLFGLIVESDASLRRRVITAAHQQLKGKK